MFGARLTNTSTENLKPLGTAPQRSFELITETVRDTCDDAHAALFAEPVSTEFGDRFDWYATTNGKPANLKDLSDDEQTVARDLLSSMIGRIRHEGQALLASDSTDDQRLGEALVNAVEYPGEASVFVLRNQDGLIQPVLVNWAWVEDSRTVARSNLSAVDTRAKEARPEYVTTATAAHEPRTDGQSRGKPDVSAVWLWLVWLGWILLGALVAVVVYLLIEPCALNLSWTTNTCPTEQSQKPNALDEQRNLLDQIAQLERQIGIADRACQPDPSFLPIPDPVKRADRPDLFPDFVPPVLPDVKDRAERAGAQLGDLNFTLIWDGQDDLDLSVACPSGGTLNYFRRETCRGQLDLDSNALVIVDEPVENAFYIDPLPGAYKVIVNMFENRDGSGQRSFKLQITDGDTTSVLEGQVSSTEKTWTHTYNYGGK